MELTQCTVERAASARESADVVVRALRSALGGELRGRRVSVWGLECCNPGTLARVSGVRLVEALLDAGAAVSAHDAPASLAEANARLGNRALLLDDAYLAALEAEALVLTSAWPRERRPDLERLRACMARPFLLDARAGFDALGLVGFRFGRGFGRVGLAYSGLLGRPGDA